MTEELVEGDYLDRRENVLLVGPAARASRTWPRPWVCVSGADYTVWADLYGTDFSGPIESSSAASTATVSLLLAPQREVVRLESDGASTQRMLPSDLPRRDRCAAAMDDVVSELPGGAVLRIGAEAPRDLLVPLLAALPAERDGC